MTDITLTDAAAKIIKAEVSAFKSDGKRYQAYVETMNVTLDTVPDHVAIFRDAFKSANKTADVTTVKAFATKVRNGLNRQLGKVTAIADRAHFLVTTDGLAALSDITPEEFLKAVMIEWENRTADKAA